MKKISSAVISFLMAISIVISPFGETLHSKAEKNEMRAAWISTVFNIDWPSESSYGNPERQKNEYIVLLDKLKSAGINTVVVQVRPESDAIYSSKINPWSRFLTGKQGKDPGYDPLDFIIKESHKKGIEVHAWFNPYRASIYSDKSSTSPSNSINKHPEWVKKFNGKWYYDPGIPAVNDYIVETVAEVVKNYDVDGVHFDDYFYPSADFPDNDTFSKFGSGNKDAWRRTNINNMIRRVRDKVHSINPKVRFGVSPAGIWRNSYNDPNGSKTSGGESYNKQFADTRYWIKNGIVDYVVPQVYWRIGHPKADYETLVKWWSDQVKGTNVDLYIGQGIYKHGQKEYAGENVAREIKKQIIINRKYPDVKGSMYFSAKDIVNQPQVYNDLRSLYMDEEEPVKPVQDSQVRYRLPYQNSVIGKDRAETAIEISKRGWPNGSQKAVLVNGEDTVSGVAASPLAAADESPILLTFHNKVSESTIREMKRLNVSELTVIDNNNSINNTDINMIKKSIPSIHINKISAKNPQQMSVKIAEQLSLKKSPSKIYVASEDAMVDVLSIASKAGNERNPIIVTGRDNVSSESLSWIKNSGVRDMYIIGGRSTISDNVLNQIAKASNSDMSEKRISGSNRIETNSKVIEKFYNGKFSKKAFIARSDAPIDAITVSAFAQKTDSPVILAGNKVSENQKNVLEPRSASLVYKVGGKINQNSYSKIFNLLGGVMK